MPKDNKPKEIFIPSAGKYRAAVLLVNTKDEHGRPKLCTFLHEEQSIHLAGGEEFVIVYAGKSVYEKKGKKPWKSVIVWK